MPKIKFGPKPSTDDITYLDTQGMFRAGTNHVKYALDKTDSSLELETDHWYFEGELDALIDFLKAARKALRKGKPKA